MATRDGQWWDATWSPVTGCQADYPCWQRCWARSMCTRYAKQWHLDPTEPFTPTFHEDWLETPLHWKKPRVVFCCAMGDLFAEGVKKEWQDAVFCTIATSIRHTYVLLTKRPDRLCDYIEAPISIKRPWRLKGPGLAQCPVVFPNLVIGTSLSTQAEWDERVPVLCRIPAWRRIVSVEPCLGEIETGRLGGDILCDGCDMMMGVQGQAHEIFGEPGDPPELCGYGRLWPAIHGIICGGETGPGARPMDLQWARDLRDQCKAAGVCFFMKQLDKKQPIPQDLMIRQLCWTKENEP